MSVYICPICQGRREIIFAETILKKYRVDYIYCSECGLLQTEEPHWLEEAYSSAIAYTDTGLIYRNFLNSRLAACLLYYLYGKHGKYLDVAGGYGMLTRLMRDIGFDFYWTDNYCENLFAKGFELNTTNPPFMAITAFEVLEHIYDPLGFFLKSFSNFESKTVIFSTELFKVNPPRPAEWWYYSFGSGQHISFYQEITLKFIARKLNLNLHTHGNLHMLTDRIIKNPVFRILTCYYAIPLFFKYICSKMESKTFSDHQLLSLTNDYNVL